MCHLSIKDKYIIKSTDISVMTLANVICQSVTCKSFEQARVRFILHSYNCLVKMPLETTCSMFKITLLAFHYRYCHYFLPLGCKAVKCLL